MYSSILILYLITMYPVTYSYLLYECNENCKLNKPSTELVF